MLFFSIFFIFAQAQSNRIESNFHNVGAPSKLFLKPGLISVIEFPQQISEVRIGNPNSVKTLISQISPKELTVFFKSANAVPTNLIVRSDRKVFVFDLIPSKSTHQDYVKIRGSVGVIGNSITFQPIQSSEISLRGPKMKKSPSKGILEERGAL